MESFVAKFQPETSPFGKHAERFNSPAELLPLLLGRHKHMAEEHKEDRDFYELERESYLETLQEMQQQIDSNSDQEDCGLMQTMQSELEDAMKYQDAVKHELDELRKEKQALRGQLDELKKELSDREEKTKQAQQELDQRLVLTVAENEQLQKKCAQLETSEGALTQSLEAEQENTAKLQGKVVELSERVRSLESENDSIKSRLQAASENIKQTNVKQASVQDELVGAQEQLSASKKECQNLQMRIQTDQEEYEKRLGALQVGKSDVETRLRQAELDLRSQRSENARLLQQAQVRKDDKQEQEQIARLRETVAHLEEKIVLQRKYMVELKSPAMQNPTGLQEDGNPSLLTSNAVLKEKTGAVSVKKYQSSSRARAAFSDVTNKTPNKAR